MTAIVTSGKLEVKVEVPFPSNRHAEIVYQVLRVDAEPKRSNVQKVLSLNNNILKAYFTGDEAKNVRVGVNSFFDNIILVTETMEQFGPPSNTYDHY